MKRSIFTIVLFVAISVLSAELFAQCPMCKMAAESNLENGGTAGKGLNMGILYMFALPYLIVGTLGLLWYRNRKKIGESQEMIGEVSTELG